MDFRWMLDMFPTFSEIQIANIIREYSGNHDAAAEALLREIEDEAMWSRKIAEDTDYKPIGVKRDSV